MNLKMVALAGVWERVLFLEYFHIISPNAMSIHYFGTKIFKDKKNVHLFLFIPVSLMVTIKSRKLVCFVNCHT